LNDPIIIVGSGLGGYTVARELRKLDRQTPLVMVTQDSGDFYSKPMLSNALAQRKSPAQLVTTPADGMAGQLDVTLLKGTRVTGIDTASRRIATPLGDYRYGALVLALGADPIRLPLAGDAAESVLSVNDLADYARFRAAVGNAHRVAVIGAGLIGCEFANDLAGAGYAVTVIDPTAYPLASLLPEAAGRSLVAPLESVGVAWRFGRSVSSVDRAQGGYRLTLDNGSTLDADVVLSAVGLRPRTALARQAGLEVNRGIVVDNHGRTSAEAVFALGDCAEYGDAVLPYVAPIMNAARALAQTLAGRPTAIVFPPMPVIVKTPACPVAVQPAPREASGQWRLLEHGEGVKMTFTDTDERLVGFALTGAKAGERAALTRLLAG
jgi:rubredoxin-NAD+ reductase